jgi:glutamate mutase epsilon subunit
MVSERTIQDAISHVAKNEEELHFLNKLKDKTSYFHHVPNELVLRNRIENARNKLRKRREKNKSYAILLPVNNKGARKAKQELRNNQQISISLLQRVIKNAEHVDPFWRILFVIGNSTFVGFSLVLRLIRKYTTSSK